jgi:uncharacterized protein YkwD
MRHLLKIITILSLVILAACGGSEEIRLAPDGKPLPKFYNLAKQDTATLQYRMLDSVNALRDAAGSGPLVLNAELNAAAATHSRDMSLQNRPWHFGSDGSSPLERVSRVGYDKVFLGETISETYENEIATLSAWMENPDTRWVILDNNATDMGFQWFQESNGKIWWTLVTGGPSLSKVALTAE